MKRISRAASRPMSDQRGIALIVVLWITVMLTVIASSFAFSMRSEALAARNTVGTAQARAVADGAIDRAAFELMRPRTAADAWAPDGRLRQWKDGDVLVTIAATDETAKIDLNTAAEPLLRGLLTNVGGLDQEAAQRVLEAILDWRDGDDLRRPNGAEQSEYQAAGLKYRPPNAFFESVAELRLVLGVTGALYDRVAPALTIYSRQAGINPVTASRDVLLALPNVTAEQVDTYINQRREALAASLPVPAFVPAQGLMSAAVPVWRIHAEAVLPDGISFVRDAVVRPTGDPRRALIALLWQEGSRTLPTSAAPDPAMARDRNDGPVNR